MGSAPGPAPDHLRNGLWAAGQLLSAAGSAAHAFKRVLIFSADPNPAGAGPSAHDSRCGAPPPRPPRSHASPPHCRFLKPQTGTLLGRHTVERRPTQARRLHQPVPPCHCVSVYLNLMVWVQAPLSKLMGVYQHRNAVTRPRAARQVLRRRSHLASHTP